MGDYVLGVAVVVSLDVLYVVLIYGVSLGTVLVVDAARHVQDSRVDVDERGVVSVSSVSLLLSWRRSQLPSRILDGVLPCRRLAVGMAGIVVPSCCCFHLHHRSWRC